MSDTQETPAEVETTETVENTPENVETEPAQDGTDWKAEARKWEDRAKGNKTAADERDAHAARVAELEAQVAGYESAEQVRKDVADVAKEHGVDPSLLRGANRDELDAHAVALKSFIESRPAPPVIPNQGKTPDHKSVDPNREAVRKLFRGEDQ